MGTAALTDAQDPTIYPEEERVGEEMLQRWIAEFLRPLLERFLNQPDRAHPSFVGADQFIYYRQYNSHCRFAPDVYVLPKIAPTTRVRSWKTWVERFAPSFALEVVSKDWEKDYVDSPSRCGEAGIGELVIFDPNWAKRPGGAGARWQVYRRDEAGRFKCVESHNRDRVWCASIDAWLRAVGFGDRTLLRIGTGVDGDQLFPTQEEAERAEKEAALAEKEAERAAKEAALAEKEAALAEKEAERAEKEALLERLRALEDELTRIKKR